MNHSNQEFALLDHLLIEAKKDDTRLYEMSMTYIYLMASSNIEFLQEYQPKIIDVINHWRGSLKTANALYYLVNGYSLFFLTKPVEGLKELQQSFKYCDDTDLFKGIKGAGYMGLGVCNRSLGKIDQTMEDCLNGVAMINPKNPPEVWHVFIFRMLGEIHTYIGELDEAVSYYFKAKSVMESISSSVLTTARFRVYDALGICHHEMGKKEDAEYYLMAAKNIENLSKAEQSRVLCDLGILYMDDPQKAILYFEESCEIRLEAKLEDAYSTSLIYRAECLLKLGDLEKAAELLNEASELVERFNVPAKRLHLYEQFVSFHEKTDNFQEANRYFHLYDELKTAIQLEQNRNIFQIKNKLIADQHKEIEQKHTELKNTLSELAKIKVSRKALLFSIITLVVLVILTEVFLEPWIERYTENDFFSIGSKIAIAFLLKPIDSLYERILFRRALKN